MFISDTARLAIQVDTQVSQKFDELREEFSGNNNVEILRNGHLVSRASSYVIYSVEAAAIGRVVAQYGPSTRLGAIVGGQTSCKDPEIKAFEQHLPTDVDIVSCHSLHGPTVDSRGQPLVLINHRASDESFRKVESVLRCLGSKHVYLSAQEHDRITADTQAVTHAAFLSMGKAWHALKQFPWEGSRYVGGIENVKINLTLRIYSQKWHVYAGLAILNPEAHKQINQFAKSTTELFYLMLEGRREELRDRVYGARERVFGVEGNPKWGAKPLLRGEVLDQFSLGKRPDGPPLPNNHLTLLAIVDCWSALGIKPYDHMICSTPLFRLWLGVAEHLFRTPGLLDECLRVGIEDNTFRRDDLQFTIAACGWAECVSLRSFDTWRERFSVTQEFFEPRFPDAIDLGKAMVKAVLEMVVRTNCMVLYRLCQAPSCHPTADGRVYAHLDDVAQSHAKWQPQKVSDSSLCLAFEGEPSCATPCLSGALGVTALGANIPPDARITAAPQGVLGLGSPPAATSGASQVHDGLRVGMLSPGAQVVIALGGIVSATFGAGVLYFPLWSRRRKRRAAQALADKEAPPVDELAQWIRATGGDEKKRYTVVDLTRKSMGPQELDVPAPVFELPATFLRHEAP
ncbi:hypothetical protein P8C59_000640 [Phyllachora maydis]|uniref:Prephenate/arogenate dehydrogenase domain-containing protein n=1 Tax=Phyllachora maydis TaxID=1825666 RepID=A0AAD9HXT8_9PEZI|nr:hypothetical protein P8C59_000640 [Phyllachora maydis]